MQTRFDIILETVSYILENQKLGWRKRKLYYPPIDDPNDPGGEINPNWRGTDSARHAIATYGYGSPEHRRIAPLSGLKLASDRAKGLADKNPNNPTLKKRAETAHSQFWKALTGNPERSTGYVMVPNRGGYKKKR